MKTIEQILDDACRNQHGFEDVSPGTDIANRLMNCSEHTINEMIKRGYLKKAGSGLVLTKHGYNHGR